MDSLNAFTSFIKDNNRVPNVTSIDNDEVRVAKWIIRLYCQIKNKGINSLGSDRVELINKSGIPTNSTDLKYEINLEKIRIYFEENMDADSLPEDHELYRWINAQPDQYRRGSLDASLLHKLKASGGMKKSRNDLWSDRLESKGNSDWLRRQVRKCLRGELSDRNTNLLVEYGHLTMPQVLNARMSRYGYAKAMIDTMIHLGFDPKVGILNLNMDQGLYLNIAEDILEPRNFEIFVESYGLKCKARTLDQIARSTGLSNERVRQIKVKSTALISEDARFVQEYESNVNGNNLTYNQ